MNDITTIGVLGAGTMGAGIAQVAAEAGLDVIVHDPVEGATERARRRIQGFLERKVAKDQLTEELALAAAARIQSGSSLEALAVADLVVEAILRRSSSSETPSVASTRSPRSPRSWPRTRARSPSRGSRRRRVTPAGS